MMTTVMMTRRRKKRQGAAHHPAKRPSWTRQAHHRASQKNAAQMTTMTYALS